MTPEEEKAILESAEAMNESVRAAGYSLASEEQLAECQRKVKMHLALMDKVTARMLAENACQAEGSGRQSKNESLYTGIRSGYVWAAGHAEEIGVRRPERILGTAPPSPGLFPELERLNQFGEYLEAQPHLGDWGGWFSADLGDVFSKAEQLYFVMRPEDDGDRNMARNFWEFVVGNADDADQLSGDADFLRGFVLGALEAWFMGSRKP